MTVQCYFCGDEINPDAPTTWRRVTGWERKATASSRRGGSDIALRESRDEFACGPCVSLAKRDIAPTQGALL